MTKINENSLGISEEDFLSALDTALEEADKKCIQPLRDGEFTAKIVADRKNVSIYRAEKLIEQMVKDGLAERATLTDDIKSSLRRALTGGQPMMAYRLVH
jgi:hypothetical protein